MGCRLDVARVMLHCLAMELFVFGIIGLFVIGAGLAIYEWRKKTTILKHDFSLDETTQSESSRDGYRAAQAFSDAHRTGGSVSGSGGPHQ